VTGILAEGRVMRILPIRLRTLLIMMAIVAVLVAIWALLQELNRFLVASCGMDPGTPHPPFGHLLPDGEKGMVTPSPSG
jgi:hypothetical protein